MSHTMRCQSCAIDFTSRNSHLKHTAKFCDYASERDRAAAVRALESLGDTPVVSHTRSPGVRCNVFEKKVISLCSVT